MMQKKYNSLFAVLFIGSSCFGQNANTLSYVAVYKDIAIKEMKRTGIPASITLAQGIVESASGESNLAKKYNNHFGIKCKEDWKGEKTYQDDDKKNECFRVYTDALSSFKDHSNFLMNRPNYAPLFQLDPLDDSAWAYGLKKAGYATASDYPKKLLKVIDDYELSQYNFPELADEIDEVANETLPMEINNKKEAATQVVSRKEDTIIVKQPADTLVIKDTIVTKNILPIKDTLKTASGEKKETVIQLKNIKGIESPVVNSNPSAPMKTNSLNLSVLDTLKKEQIDKDTVNAHLPKQLMINTTDSIESAVKKIIYNFPKEQLFQINKVNVIWAKAGSAYLEIANQYKLPLYKIFVYNEIKETDLVNNDQLVFLGPKKKIGSKSIYTAQDGETLYEISQLNGIQLDFLRTYNPTLETTKLKAGTIVYLFKTTEIKTAEKTAAKLAMPSSPILKKGSIFKKKS